MADSKKNFSYSLVATAPDPAASGTSLTVTMGEGALFPTPPFNVTVWPSGEQPLASNAEIVRVTDITGDVFTIDREEEGTTAISIAVGYQIAATITVQVFSDYVPYTGATTNLDLGANSLTASTINVGTGSFNLITGTPFQWYSDGTYVTPNSQFEVSGTSELTTISEDTTAIQITKDYSKLTGGRAYIFPDQDGTVTVDYNYGMGTVSVANGGSGYSVNDVLSVSGGALGTVLVLSAPSGIIDSISINNAGYSYSLGVKTTSGGGNNDATINIDTVTPVGFVPYLGGAGDVYLGSFNLYGDGVVGMNDSDLNLIGGTGITGAGKDVVITGGASLFTDGGGGNVVITAGAPNGIGGDGQIRFSTNRTFYGNFYFGDLSDSDKTYTFPDASGTIALTSDISGYVPYIGASSDVDLGANSIMSDSVTVTNGGEVIFDSDLVGTQAGRIQLSISGFNMIDSVNDKQGIFSLSSLTANTPRTYTLQDADGTIALTSDIPTDSDYIPYNNPLYDIYLGGQQIYMNIDSGINWTDSGNNDAPMLSLLTDTPNTLELYGPTSGFSAKLDVSDITTVDKTFTFPNKDGTFAMLDDISGTWDDPFGDAEFAYDVDGNVETKTVGATVLTFTYDVDGNVDTISDGTNVKTFTYNLGGDLTDIVYT